MNEPTLSGALDANEVSILDLLVSGWRVVLVAVLLGAAAGAGFFYATPLQWEASATLRIGQVAGKPIEPAVVAAERGRRDVFVARLREVLGWQADGVAHRQGTLLRDSMRISLVGGADMVRAAFRVHDVSDARRVAAALADEFRRPHDALAEPQVARLKAELADLEMQLSALESDRGRIVASITKRAEQAPGGQFPEQVLASNLLVESNRELGKQRQRRLLLQEELSAAMTFPTELFGGLDLSEKPVFPRRGASVAAGSLFGFLLGAALVLLAHSRRRVH